MKPIQLLHSLLLAATCTAAAFANSAQRQQQEFVAAPAGEDLVPLVGLRQIKVGMTTAEVVASMRGKPDDQMTADTWIYWDFKGLKRPTGMSQPAMIVFFTGGRVSLIRYSEGALVRKVLAEYRATVAPSFAAK